LIDIYLKKKERKKKRQKKTVPVMIKNTES